MKTAAQNKPGGEEQPAKPKIKKPLTPKQQKQRKIMYSAGGVCALIALIVWYGLQPLTGTIHIGICRTFAELQLRYPQSFRLTDTEQFGRAYRIYYVFTGAFGETQSHMMECKFMTDAATGALILEKVDINRQPIDKQKVAAFNKTIPAVVAAKPSLILPARSDSLLDLKKD